MPSLPHLPLPFFAAELDVKAPLVTAIKTKEIDLVVSVPSRSTGNAGGEYLLRRVATDYNVPLLTNMRLVEMLADALEKHSHTPMTALSPDKLGEYYSREKPSDAWTGAREFH